MQSEVRSFVVRLWSEAADDGKKTWRGTVRDVLSGDLFHFQDFNALAKCIEQCSRSDNIYLTQDEDECNANVSDVDSHHHE